MFFLLFSSKKDPGADFSVAIPMIQDVKKKIRPSGRETGFSFRTKMSDGRII